MIRYIAAQQYRNIFDHKPLQPTAFVSRRDQQQRSQQCSNQRDYPLRLQSNITQTQVPRDLLARKIS